METLIDQSGLVAGSDYLSLSRTMTLKQSSLADSVTGATHKLHPKAVKSLELLEMPLPYELWSRLNNQYKLLENEALDILLFLNNIGGLKIRRTTSGTLDIIIKKAKHMFQGQSLTLRSQRWDANLPGICLGVLAAMVPLISMVAVMLPFLYWLSPDRLLVILLNASFLAVVYISTVGHEATHNFIISYWTSNKVFLQRGLRLGILHRTIPKGAQTASALAGPLVGVVVSLLVAYSIGLMFDHETWLAFLGIIVASFHLVSLLPFYGDGRVIWYKDNRSI